MEISYAEDRSDRSHKKLVSNVKNVKEPEVRALKVYNIVTTVRLFPDGLQINNEPVRLNLVAAACQLRGKLGSWNPQQEKDEIGVDERFPSCVSRCRETGTTNSLFSSGMVVMAGSRDIETALLSVHLLSWRLQKDLGLHYLGVIDFKVCNVVTAFGLGYWLNIPKILKDFPLQSEWTPEHFKGNHRDLLPGTTTL